MLKEPGKRISLNATVDGFGLLHAPFASIYDTKCQINVVTKRKHTRQMCKLGSASLDGLFRRHKMSLEYERCLYQN